MVGLMKSVFRFIRNNRVLRRRRNGHLLHRSGDKSHPNRVNLNYWWNPSSRAQGVENFGDMLSPVIVRFLLERRGIDPDKPVGRTKHLFAIGSILFWRGSWQDMTVWGTGCMSDLYTSAKRLWKGRINHHLRHRVDVRAVRGPRTRDIMRRLWLKCPEVYGDPAILLPLFYQPTVEATRAYNLIPHKTNRDWLMQFPEAVDILTADWRRTVDGVCAARLNISSSLHGIVISEAYGIPAVLLQPDSGPEKPKTDLFKFDDYYLGTGRKRYPVAKTIEEALELPPPPLPEWGARREALIDAFPYDLWEV